MTDDLPDLQADLSRGDPGAAMAWLGEKIHRHGSVFEPSDVIARAIGHAPSEAPLLDYLKRKFAAIYEF